MLWVKLCPHPKKDMLKSQPLVSMNVTLFGNRVFAEVIKRRRGHAELGRLPNLMTGVLMRKERFGDTETDTSGRPHEATAENGEIHLQAGESWNRQGKILPLRFWRECGPANTLLDFRFLAYKIMKE